jgi:hypothetical protein
MEKICIYKGKIYCNARRLADNRILIVDSHEEEWDLYDPYDYVVGDYINTMYYDILKKSNMHSKIVEECELDDFYALEYKVVYRGYNFTLCGGLEKLLEGEERCISISIPPAPCEIIEKLALKPVDRMEYGCKVSREEIDGLLIKKKFLMGEKNGQKIEWKTDIFSYAEIYPDCLYRGGLV